MEAVINIATPILEMGEEFYIRYRKLPAGDWAVFGTITSNSFTITGLDVGEYEVEISFVKADGTVCHPVLIQFEIEDVPACTCGYITDVYVQKDCVNKTANLYVTFEDNYECATKYMLTYTQFGGLSPNTIEYDTNPSTVVIPLSLSGSSVPPRITVQIECCDGTIKTCYDMPVTDIRECECRSAPQITGGNILFNALPLPLGTHSIQFNFSAGAPIPAPPYTIEYFQLNTLSPVTPISTIETTDGYKIYEVDVVPHTGDLSFRVKVTTACGVDQFDMSVLKCGTNVDYLGGESFPNITSLYIGGLTGYLSLNFNSFEIPDKFEIVRDGVVISSSGYRGNISYQPALDDALAARGLPPEPIIGTGIGGLAFYSPTPVEWIHIHVYAPLNNTRWSYTTFCQFSPPS